MSEQTMEEKLQYVREQMARRDACVNALEGIEDVEGFIDSLRIHLKEARRHNGSSQRSYLTVSHHLSIALDLLPKESK